MVYDIRFYPFAIRALDGIYEWGVRDSGKKAAKRFVNKIAKKILDLRKSPYICSVEPMLEGYPQKYRSLVAHSYFKVIYYIDEDAKIIYVADIWDTRMDPEELQSHVNMKFQN